MDFHLSALQAAQEIEYCKKEQERIEKELSQRVEVFAAPQEPADFVFYHLKKKKREVLGRIAQLKRYVDPDDSA